MDCELLQTIVCIAPIKYQVSLQYSHKFKKMQLPCAFIIVLGCSSMYCVRTAEIRTVSFSLLLLLTFFCYPHIVIIFGAYFIDKRKFRGKVSQAPTRSRTAFPQFMLTCFALFSYYDSRIAYMKKVLNKGTNSFVSTSYLSTSAWSHIKSFPQFTE